MESTLVFRIVTTDVGCTQAAEVFLGPISLGRWYTGTKYDDRSINEATKALVVALKPLVDAAMEEVGNRPYTDDYWDDGEDWLDR